MTGRDKDIITSGDLDTILDVNRKAIELHTEVSGQNENILEHLEKENEKLDTILKVVEETNSIKEKIEDIDKNIFRLLVILSTIGVGTIIAIIQQFFHH